MLKQKLQTGGSQQVDTKVFIIRTHREELDEEEYSFSNTKEALFSCSVCGNGQEGKNTTRIKSRQPTSSAPARGLTNIPLFTHLKNGDVKVPVVNTADEDIMVPTRTVVGRVSQAAEKTKVRVQSVASTNERGQQRAREAACSVKDNIGRLKVESNPNPGEAVRLMELLPRNQSLLLGRMQI
ncbi:hypothetical protein ElyMa_000610900 [Elysia marginata]|uniref:Uncharacterized protein n=1 Tax=Elysia marginata TaxID=1093978 RepID=A0AAV4G8C7_9GAST|nr:hypothetical protein ElyMa_000610900 [Elysia marginata]